MTGPEKWVPEAIAEQEEYIRRVTSCGGMVGKAHNFQTFRRPDSPVPVPNEITWRQCTSCDVTETRDDYARKLDAQK